MPRVVDGGRPGPGKIRVKTAERYTFCLIGPEP